MSEYIIKGLITKLEESTSKAKKKAKVNTVIQINGDLKNVVGSNIWLDKIQQTQNSIGLIQALLLSPEQDIIVNDEYLFAVNEIFFHGLKATFTINSGYTLTGVCIEKK